MTQSKKKKIQTEYLEVIQGRALVTVDDSTALFGPDDGVITVPRLTIHSFQRADAHPDGAAWRDVELRIREWTSPPDGRKEAFFRNMLGVLEDRRGGVAGVARLVLGLAAVMWEHDNYPVLVRGPAFMGSEAQLAIRRAVTHAVLGGVHFVARLCGIRGTYEEYTPKDILEELKQK
jgi:hypothetical protein